MTKNITGPILASILLHAKSADGRWCRREREAVTETTVPTVFTAFIWMTNPGTGLENAMVGWSPSVSGPGKTESGRSSTDVCAAV